MADAPPTEPVSSQPKALKPGLTPMMAQYLGIKQAHPDDLLFYRMGDFYEMFFDDAVKASAALDITLTKRGKHENEDIPMCGVPVHASEGYLSRLIRKGFRVAVCEQTENPTEAKKRGAKSVVAREVVRVVTPGTITEDELLDARRHNYLAALADAQGALGLAWLDMSTGAFCTQQIDHGQLSAVLAGIDPGELLVTERLLEQPDLFEIFTEWKNILTPQPGARFDSESARLRLEELYGVKALEGFGGFSRAEIAACGALVDYIELTQKGRLPRLTAPRRISSGATMEIDAATRRNLELTETLSGSRDGTLLSVIDRTVTGAGGRLMAARIASPLTDPAAIGHRLDMVSYFHDDRMRRDGARGILRGCPDMERALSRVTLGRGGPRDLAAIRDALSSAHGLRDALAGEETPPSGIGDAVRDLGYHSEIIDRFGRALRDELPILARDGGFIADGYLAELDEHRRLRDESRQLIAALQRTYAEQADIPSLKIRHNNVLGYFIETTPTHADKIDIGADSPFIHRQTLASAVRFTTVELGEMEANIGRAADRVLALELALLDDLISEVTARVEPIALAAGALAALDVAAALAQIAAERGYVRPVIDDSVMFDIEGGRHPVVEAALAARREGEFVSNSCHLASGNQLWLLTGPNMAGKSTFLRQNALIAVLGQAGCFVPADRAHMGVVDRLFSRVGAADDLARGRSTFMVEMVETAIILNQATERSLVILDEIGRGTATFDGLSIAWAALEHLHGINRCRAFFATHFHELTSLTARLDGMSCHTMRVKEWQGDVVFLHEVIDGAADRSYGIHVARLAGLPQAVISRAEDVLAMLEQGEQSGALTRLADDLPLFSADIPTALPVPGPSPLETELSAINPDELSPLDALSLIYRLRRLQAD